MAIALADLVADLAGALTTADARRPVFKTYKPGIGPHGEDEAVALALRELRTSGPARYGDKRTGQQLPYPGSSLRADLWIGDPLEWVFEVKMARFFLNNGNPEDTGIKDILSPFDEDRSALTDTSKLASSRFPCRKGIIIYGFTYPTKPLPLIISAFELLAKERVEILESAMSPLGKLVHPVHATGAVYGWEIGSSR